MLFLRQIVAMMAGFGWLFICAIPMASITGIRLSVLVGIGLDDSFIMEADFFLHPQSLPIEEPLHKTMHNVGLSVFTTSMTLHVPLALDASAAFPVYWVSFCAFPTISL